MEVRTISIPCDEMGVMDFDFFTLVNSHLWELKQRGFRIFENHISKFTAETIKHDRIIGDKFRQSISLLKQDNKKDLTTNDSIAITIT